MSAENATRALAPVMVRANRLRTLIFRIFEAAGCAQGEAEAVGTRLVDASCAGHHSHGVVRVMRYLDWIEEGKLIPNQVPTIEVDAGSMAIVDGHHGFGQTMAPFAVDLGCEKALATGISVVGLKRSGHLGRLGDWAERAASAGICSIHFANVNGHALVAPFGGTERRFSTAPFAIGIPRLGSTPIVLDFATSLVAEGKVLVAAKGGTPIPDDALVMPDGELGGDPRILYGDTLPGRLPHPSKGEGAIRAFGEHKGSGLAFMCEVLAGLMTESGANASSRGQGQLWSGMLGIYIEPTRLDQAGNFDQKLAEFVDFVRSSKPIKSGRGVMVPGEPEEAARKDAEANGVSLPGSVWTDLLARAERLRVNAAA